MHGDSTGRSAAIIGAVLTLLAGCVGTVQSGTSMLQQQFPRASQIQEEQLAGNGAGTRLWIARANGDTAGYAVRTVVESRSGEFPIMVIVDARHRVRDVRVFSYTAQRGRAVQRPAFARQFAGKGRGDPIKVGQDIDAMTGATLSSRAVAQGVRRALRLVQKVEEG